MSLDGVYALWVLQAVTGACLLEVVLVSVLVAQSLVLSLVVATRRVEETMVVAAGATIARETNGSWERFWVRLPALETLVDGHSE